MNEDDRAVQKKEQQAKEDKQRTLERQMESKKIDLHKEWRSFVAQRRYSVPPGYQTPSCILFHFVFFCYILSIYIYILF